MYMQVFYLCRYIHIYFIYISRLTMVLHLKHQSVSIILGFQYFMKALNSGVVVKKRPRIFSHFLIKLAVHLEHASGKKKV